MGVNFVTLRGALPAAAAAVVTATGLAWLPPALRATSRPLALGDRHRTAMPMPPGVWEADVRQIVREIDPARIEGTDRILVSFGTRSTLSEQDNPHRGIGAARDWLLGEYRRIAAESGGRLTVEQQSWIEPTGPRVPRPTRLTNIVAMLPGERFTAEQRVYVVSGHYDSMCTSPTDGVHDAPGADDDGSGSAAVLEMARVMSRYRFDAPVVFMAVAGEEQGLLGSQHAAEEARRKGWRVRAMFTNDIIGSSLGGNGVQDRHSVRVFSEGVPSDETPQQEVVRRSVGGENDGPSRQLARYIKEVGERVVPGMRVTLIYRRDRYGRGGDHIPFLERGYPAVRFTEPNEDYRHQHQDVRTVNGVQYGDLPQFVDYGYTAQVARVNAAALAMLASAPDSPADAGIVTGLSNDTTLRWTSAAESGTPAYDPNVAGYEVVWRDTDAPLWAHSRYVGAVSECTMRGMSKDNYLFGIRAVDRAGRRGSVAYPQLARQRPVTAPSASSSNQ